METCHKAQLSNQGQYLYYCTNALHFLWYWEALVSYKIEFENLLRSHQLQAEMANS